ncbi:hypothetical protein WME95_22915 [Sorangium sp. So ce327]|uniref:hypothetical protein n=1 Tax=unclassified Sorangium TaxID=2621164 RepID=UPI003F60E125
MHTPGWSSRRSTRPPNHPRGQVDVDAVDLPAFGLADDVLPFSGDVHAHRNHQLLYASPGVLHLEVGSAHWILPPQRAAFIAAHFMHRAHAAAPVALRTVCLSPRLTQVPLPSGDPQGEERVDCHVFAVTPLAREYAPVNWASNTTTSRPVS